MKLVLVTALSLGVGLAAAAGAQDLRPGMRTMIEHDDLDDRKLQPGMRTMIPRGGREGVRLGSLFPVPEATNDDPSVAGYVHGTRGHRLRGVLHVRN